MKHLLNQNTLNNVNTPNVILTTDNQVHYLPENCIRFTIDGQEFICEQNMTWEDFINSSQYSYNKFAADGIEVISKKGGKLKNCMVFNPIEANVDYITVVYYEGLQISGTSIPGIATRVNQNPDPDSEPMYLTMYMQKDGEDIECGVYEFMSNGVNTYVYVPKYYSAGEHQNATVWFSTEETKYTGPWSLLTIDLVVG